MKVGDLFSGIGGFSLAARWMGWETAWFSEIDPYASAVLATHWPDVPNHGDVTMIDFTQVEPVDLLCGGFPCQDISNAGKHAGIEGGRSGLWRHFARAIRELRPRYVVVENVAALLVRGIDRVLGDLAALGYDAEWTVLSAADVGAPHLRRRIWVVAYPNEQAGGRVLSGRRQQFPAGGEGERDVADSIPDTIGVGQLQPQGSFQVERRRTRHSGETEHTEDERRSEGRTESEVWSRWDAPAGAGWWDVEPPVGRVVNGLPHRVDRLRGLGNAIVPQCAYEIFQAIQAADARLTPEAVS
jgi:DNA (cytosine-5)-methyltransferase 1